MRPGADLAGHSVDLPSPRARSRSVRSRRAKDEAVGPKTRGLPSGRRTSRGRAGSIAACRHGRENHDRSHWRRPKLWLRRDSSFEAVEGRRWRATRPSCGSGDEDLRAEKRCLHAAEGRTLSLEAAELDFSEVGRALPGCREKDHRGLRISSGELLKCDEAVSRFCPAHDARTVFDTTRCC